MTTKVLAFDTALNGCVVALWDSATGKAVTRSLQTDREQAAKLIPLIQAVMEEAGCTFAELGLIVTTVGPGSFTGLRISLSTARSFGLSLNVPLQGVGTLEAMARTCVSDQPMLVVLETKRTDYYVQSFTEEGAPRGEPYCTGVEEILAAPERFICGDGVPRLQRELGDCLTAVCRVESMINPAVLAQIGFSRYRASGGNSPALEPVYLRGADVSMSNKTQREIKNIPPL